MPWLRAVDQAILLPDSREAANAVGAAPGKPEADKDNCHGRRARRGRMEQRNSKYYRLVSVLLVLLTEESFFLQW